MTTKWNLSLSLPARVIGIQLTGRPAEHDYEKADVAALWTASEACALFTRQNGRGLPKSLYCNTQHAEAKLLAVQFVSEKERKKNSLSSLTRCNRESNA